MLFALAPALPSSAQSQPGTFAHDAFRSAWERTDRPVAEGLVARTWVWGPTPGRFNWESFREGGNGMHLVQYFDKARMEINDLNDDRNSPFFVTNGLLVVEMISGKIQVGANLFEQNAPSDVRIVGDEGSDAPSYSSLQRVASVGIQGQENRARQIAPGAVIPPARINRLGDLEELPLQSLERPVIYSAGYVPETGHNIASIFMDYFNTAGPIYQDGRVVNGPMFNWLSAFGYPVTEPYWTTIRVAGQERQILFQAFQRRILTYSPQNPAGWKVEMGNVGAQYYTWRYETPALACARVPIRGFGRVWAANRSVQAGVGCPIEYPPFNTEMVVQTAYQPFENGAMLWISRTTWTQEKLIYVFFSDGTFQQFDDTWREGEPVNSGLTPPPGRYEPARGFGKVWREGTGARVRERLGWATEPERGGNGAYQRLQKGEMYWSSAVDKIWVLYGTVQEYPMPTPGPGTRQYRYEVFNDTY
jgi:hypothetical protein